MLSWRSFTWLVILVSALSRPARAQTVVPRNGIEGEALHRVDVRLTKVFDFGSVRVSGIAEVFNLFNHANYGSYQGFVNRSNFGNPTQNLNIAYGPRAAQFAFRFEF